MPKYKEIPVGLDLVSIEKEILDGWKKAGTFEKVDSRKAREWVYYDGPITANGIPHYGHAITWTMKDVVPRYYTMRNYHVSRNMGWDCQGILVEYEVEKKLDFQHKSDIEKYGIDKFNQACRDSVLKFRQAMIDYETRLGRWIDHNDEYSTMDSSYIESVWWAVKSLHEKGLLYKGHKVVAYSTRAGMTLSSHEVADGGYKEVVDLGVTVKFKLKNQENTYFLAWTTTPWTLPGNLMLALGKKIKYVKVSSEGKKYILAENAVERIFSGRKYKVLEEVSAGSILSVEYEPLFPYYKQKSGEGAFKTIYADHVNTEEGTGIVHLAPYGEEDFAIFLKMGIKLFDYIDETGNFTSEIPEYKGLFYKTANKRIIEDLMKNELLFKVEDYTHQMPVSYRTKEPLIYKPIESWYVNVGKIKQKLVSEAKKVNWVPEKSGRRFLEWIKNARDWSLSRIRYWGTPMPVWVNDKTGDIKIVGSFKELEIESGVSIPENFDPHRPYIDEITWKSKDGGVYRRVPEVIDVWFDSGSMPFAQYHYPFENEGRFNSRFPAEYISESDDQIRLWFYTMFVLGVALFERSPFKNVVVSGMLGDEKGQKMSKSKGNYPPIEEVFENYGSDMLRYFLLSSPITRGEFTSFSYSYLLETKKQFFTTLWNSFRYYITYANLNDFTSSGTLVAKDILDQWILVRLNQVVKNMRNYMDKYEVMYAVKELSPFVNDLSTWYIRRSRDRLSAGDKSALWVLEHVLFTLTKLMAPFMPLLSDYMYKILADKRNGVPESVHLADFPECEEKTSDSDIGLLELMDFVRKVVSSGNALRKESKIPVRQPLSVLVVKAEIELQAEYIDLIKDELNVKEVRFMEVIPKGKTWSVKKDNDIYVALDIKLTDDLLVEGYARELVREIQKLRKQANVAWDAKLKVQYPVKDEYEKAVRRYKREIMDKASLTDLVPGDKFKVL
ncbi:hypothetical protein A2982_04295 [candidate division WWE3 bacterium RIFCSPLOWO2_01_FULL_39_13]|uniref:Isoleucine--tRNA ligase n=1 Tax=candidate division WWE3 bacterium RIFCSPLOWO2_01_FULL_39_13 TaxID=1802624 RepID=A0A1F4V295_UNCKA|nr:MAG: hypothetical protein A2982_04295 [candidate division WWE3 bacterium RIFCSPLOWO2_01_FULL_39_13]